MKIKQLFILVIASFILLTSTMANDLPRVFIYDSKTLAKKRAEFKKNANDPLLAKIKRNAEGKLRSNIPAIITKKLTPPSGDKRDYVSQAPYFWKDPKSPNGLPYINRDGERNPEILEHPDGAWLGRVVNAVVDLSYGYFFTGDERYGKKAAEILRLWFIDEKTRMNPNLQFGQGIPGRYAGRPFGLIETIKLTQLADQIGLLEGTKSLSAADNKALIKWYADFLKWMETSDLGIAEGKTLNNHAVFYDLQTASYALFIGDKAKAKQILEAAKTKRIATQIEPNGSQPHELARTRSWDYSTMNLEGFLGLAKLGEAVGVDLWNYKTADGRAIRNAIDYLYPFAVEPKTWKTKQIVALNEARLFKLINRTAAKYNDAAFKKMLTSAPKPAQDDLELLTAY